MSQTTIRNNKISKWFASITAKTVYITNINTETRIVIKKENILYQFLDPLPSFTGRQQTLEDIHNILKNKKCNNIAVVCGFGGIGKSELIRAYGKKYFKFCNKNILWINSETHADILGSFRGLAPELGVQTKIYNNERFLHQIVTDIYNYLKKQTLIIFDNARCYKDLQQFLPVKEDYQHIHVIISSQNNEWGDIEKIQLDVLSNTEAHDLLINQLDEYLGASEKDVDIPELALSFQYMPLALQQAAAYIIDKKKYVSKNYKIRDYINEIDKADGRILNHDFEGSPFPHYANQNYDKTVTITVQMMIDKIKNSGKNLPLLLLYLISYLPSDNIDKELFSFMSRREAYRDENLDESIRFLAKYSAVTVQDTEKREISIHRLVQKLLRFIIKSNDLHKIILNDALHVTQDFVYKDDVYFNSVLDYVKEYPEVYLNFYEKNEDQIGILNLITRHNCFEIIENIFESEYIDLNDNTIILQAVRTANLEMVKFLVGKGANIYSKDDEGWTPFQYSLGLASIELAEYFIDLGVNIDEPNDKSFTPLAIAASSNIDMVNLLLDKGVAVKTNFEVSPLITACVGGHLDILKLLIEKGIPIQREIMKEGVVVKENAIPSEILGQILENSHLNIMEFLLENNICKLDHIPFDECLSKIFIENNFPLIDFCLKSIEDLGNLLFLATAHGNDYAVERVLQQDVNVNTRQREQCTPLYIASQEGHLSTVKLLIRHGADIDLTREDNETPLSAAAKNGHMEIVKFLVNRGADVNIQGMHSFTPAGLALSKEHDDVFKYLYELETVPTHHLLLCSYLNNVTIAEFLIKKGADINMLDEHSYNALMYAAEMNNINIMNFLLNKRADINKANVDGETALFRAVREDRVEAVKLLVSRGADLNIQRIDLQSALEVAVQNGCKEIVEILVENKANLHGLNFNLLGYATCAGNVEIFEYLFERDPSLLFMELETKQTLAHVAAEMGHVHMFNILIEKGISLDTRDFQGMTPIGIAASMGQTATVEYLLQIGCDVNSSNDFGNALLQQAVADGHLDTVQLLLRYNATVDYPDGDGDTALHDAAFKGHFPIVKCLLDHGANINLPNFNGMTPLHLAAAGGHLEIVEYLLINNAEVMLENNIGLLPRIVAQEKGHVHIVECFQRFGF